MNLTVYFSDDDCMSAREVMEKIAKDKGWKIVADPQLRCGTDFKISHNGRIGTYDVEMDLLIWDDDPDETEYALFGYDEWSVGVSLPEYLSGTDGVTGVWGDGDDGIRYFALNY